MKNRLVILVLTLASLGLASQSDTKNLTAVPTTASSSSSVSWTFAWDYPAEASDQITNYNFYEVINGTNSLVASVPISANRTYILDGANISRGTHTYLVTAVNDAAESSPSNQCSIQKKTPPGGTPTNLHATQN